MSALPDSFALSPAVLAQEDAAEFLEPGRRVVESPDDRLAVTDRQREHAHHPPERILKPSGQFGVIHEAGELQHKFIADRETGQVHRTYVLYPASGLCQVAETDVAS